MKPLLKRNKRTLLFIFSVVLVIFILPVIIPALFVSSPAVAQTQIIISTSVPGTYGAAASGGAPGAYVADFYWFALIIGGVLAFGVVVYGGVKYMTSAGNPSGQSDAKEWVEAAILGLLLLVGVYFILSVINPQLLNLNLPSLTPVNISSIVVPGNPAGGANGPTTPPKGCAGGTCVTLPNCTQTKTTTGAGAVNCGGAPAVAAVLNCVNQADPNYTVAEGYPPAVDHSDPGHNTGCAIDVHVNGCAAGAAFMSAAKSCGASKVLNEYSGCGGTTYTHTSGGNIHIDAPKGQGGC
jgi:hypothetical protein